MFAIEIYLERTWACQRKISRSTRCLA